MNRQPAAAVPIDTPPLVEALIDGLELQWYGERAIAVFVLNFQDVRHAHVELFVQHALKVMHEWPADKPLRLVYHIATAAYSRHVGQRSREELSIIPAHLYGRVAIVLPKSPLSQLLRLFVRNTRNPNVPHRTFDDVDTALSWAASAIE